MPFNTRSSASSPPATQRMTCFSSSFLSSDFTSFFLGCNLGVSWGKRGEFWGSLLSKVLTATFPCIWFDLQTSMQISLRTEGVGGGVYTLSWVSVCAYEREPRDYCLHALSCPPPAARSCLGYLLWCWFFFLVMKMFPSDRTGFTKFCMQVWIRTKGCVCVCVCSHWVCLCCITKEWGTHVPSSF